MNAGYKQSELGSLPADWEVLPLGESLAGRPRYGINAAAVPFSDRLPTYIRITDISPEGQFAPAELVSVDAAGAADYFLSEGDIVFARTGASVGKSYLYRSEDGPLVFAGFLIRVKPDDGRLLPGYLAAYVTTGPFWSWVRLMSMRSGQPGINGNEFAKLPVPHPPLAEQRAIAGALGDVDGLLGGLERLIAKKRDLKQAAMQQLLTGQTRLPGFSGKWDHVPLSQVVDVIRGGIYGVETKIAGLVPMLVATTAHISDYDLWNDKEMSVRYFTPEQVARYSPRVGDLIVVKSSGSAASIKSGKLALVTEREAGVSIFSNFLLLLRPHACRAEFLYSFLTSHTVKSKLPSLVEASTYPNLRLGEYLAIQVPLPDHPEQHAIAAVLSDMDAEIAALERRRDKTRLLKQGMMQELLTGRTRLV